MEPQSSSDPDWLRRLQSDMTWITQEAAKKHWPGPAAEAPPYYNYRLEHVRQVARDGLRLLAAVGGDHDVLLAAIWIHDRFQPQYNGLDHARKGAIWTQEALADYGFPQEKIPSVSFAVANHSNPPDTIPAEAHEARLLWDADKLSKLGLLSVVAYFCAHPAYPHQPVTFQDMAEFSLQHQAKSRERIAEFYFPVTRDLARQRYEAEQLFCFSLAGELGIAIGQPGLDELEVQET